MPIEDDVLRALIGECRERLIVKLLPKIRTCVDELSEDEIWFRPNEQSNSVGNLILHLCGNLGQWIVSGLGGATDIRERAREFSERGPVPRTALLESLERRMAEVDRALEQLDPTSLLGRRRVQGFEVNGIAILTGVVEHSAYHTGQIAYFVKARKGLDLAFYRGLDLNKRNEA